MRRLLLAALVGLAAGSAAAQPVPPPRYSEVRIALATPGDLSPVTAAGVALDHPQGEDGGRAVVAVVNADERARLERAGVVLEILVEDLAAAYAARQPPTASERAAALRGAQAGGFEFGSMGGYYTLAELEAELDSLRADYPTLISEKVSIGQSGQGRTVWMVRVSNTPDVDSPDPAVLLTALHHAREPQSMATVLYALHYLLERYGTDPEITALVDARELYVVPVVNPDGYAYNEATNPNGGGFWRKNRRANAGGTFGVDPNRNYGYEWGRDNVGSSGTPSSEVYRGPAPFSEPEVAAVRDLALTHAFVSAIHFHSRGEEYLYPWSYQQGVYTPDDDRFQTLSAEMARFNGYTWGASPDVLYAVNGGANDWFYGEQTLKPLVLSWTAEVCNRTTDGFWPPLQRIVPIAEENLHAILTLLREAGTPPVSTPPPPAAAAGLRVWPTPTAGAVHVEGAEGAVEVYDVQGRRVLRLAAGVTTADLGALGPGVYAVRSGQQTRTVVVAR